MGLLSQCSDCYANWCQNNFEIAFDNFFLMRCFRISHMYDLLLKVLKVFHEIVVGCKALKFNLERIWPHYATSLQAIADITNEFLIVSNYNPLLSFCLLSPLFFTLCLFLELFYLEIFHIACPNCSNVEHLVRHLQIIKCI